MDSREPPFRRPVSGIGDPVYTTPNSPSLPSPLPSSLSSPSRSSSSRLTISPLPSSKSVSFSLPPSNQIATAPPPLNLDMDKLKDILATVAKNVPPSPSANSTLVLPSNPTLISQRLTELLREEEEITSRRNNLENELAEIRSKEKDISQQRSQLIRQLDRVVSPQSNVSTQAITAASPSANSSPVRPAVNSTIIEPIPDSEPNQPRSSDLNSSINSSMIRKRPGPASKTILKQINPGSLPPLGPTSSLAKKLRRDNGDVSHSKPVTTGVKQSRPQPMRARKRNKPDETESNTEPQSDSTSQDQTSKDKQPSQPPQSPLPLQPQPSQQQQPQPQPQLKQKATTSVQKSQSSSTKSQITKEDVKPTIKEEKHKNSADFKNLELTSSKSNPFKERVDNQASNDQMSSKVKIKQEPGTKSYNQIIKPKKTNVVTARDDDDGDSSGPMRVNPPRGDSDEDAHSDSDIFGALGNLQSDEPDSAIVTTDGMVKKIKKETELPTIKKEPGVPIGSQENNGQQTFRPEIKIKKEK